MLRPTPSTPSTPLSLLSPRLQIAVRRSSDGGSAIHSSVTLGGSSSHRQLSARKGIDPRVSFHHSAGSGGSGGNGSNGGGVSLLPRSLGSAGAPSLLHQQTSRQEAAGGAGGSGLSASGTSPYHGDSLHDEGSSVSKERASSYDMYDGRVDHTGRRGSHARCYLPVVIHLPSCPLQPPASRVTKA